MFGSYAFGSRPFGTNEPRVVDDDSDGWWIGASTTLAGLALAGAVAVSTTAAQTTGNRFNSIGEELASYVPTPSVGALSPPNYRIGPQQSSVVYVFGSDDFPARGPLVSAEDESFWPQQVPKLPLVARQPIAYEDAIVPQPVSVSVGANASPSYSVSPPKTGIVFIYGGDDFAPPPPPPPPLVAGSSAPTYTVAAPKTTVVYRYSGEELPQPEPLDSGDGVIWLTVQPAYKAPLAPYTAEDFPPRLLPIGGVSQPVYRVSPSTGAVRYIFGDDQLPIAPPVPPIFEEDRYSGWIPPVAIPKLLPQWLTLEIERVLPITVEGHTFTGVISVAPRFSGVLEVSPQFDGDASIQPRFDGELSVRPA